MSSFQVFGDLPEVPQIRFDYDVPMSSGYSYPYDEESSYELIPARQGTRTVNVFGTEVQLETSAIGMSSMQRYLTNSERPLFNPPFMQPDYTRPIRSPQLRHPLDFNKPLSPQSPWPLPDAYQRHPSPGETVLSSSSASFSAYSRDELRASGYSPRSSLSNQPDRSPQETSYPDPVSFAKYSRDIPASGGSSGISLSVIQQYPDLTPSVEEFDRVDVKPAYTSYDQENYFVSTKMEVDSESYVPGHESDAYNRCHREAESVHPCPPKDEPVQDEDPSDPDYQPTSPIAKRARRTSSQSSGASSKSSSKRGSNATHRPRKSSSASTSADNHRVVKKKRSSANASSPTSGSSNTARPFSCPFAPYGCHSTFTSKNEWKRHVNTQHIRLGYWRCDLCPQHPESGHNDFNRKDLFTQHLRRMHAASTRSPAQSSKKPSKTPESTNTSTLSPNPDYPVTEGNLPNHQERCYKVLRSTPPCSSCLFCPKQFNGAGSWEERMDHVCRHFEKDRKSSTNGEQIKVDNWRDDNVLREWLIEEGLVESDEKGVWKLGDGKPKRTNAKMEGDEDGDGDEE